MKLSYYFLVIRSRITPANLVVLLLAMGIMFSAVVMMLGDINSSQQEKAFAAYSTSCTTANLPITRISSPTMYTDYPPGLTYSITSAYTGYRVTNNTGSTISDLWVRAENFTGTNIYLATNEDGVSRVGSIAPGQSKLVFFYVTSKDPGNGTFTGNHDIVLYNTKPSFAPSSICGQTFTLNSADAIAAAANKVTSYVTGPNPAELGGLVTLSICGQTGTIGAAGVFATTPATFANWPANAYELFDVSITFNKGVTNTVVSGLLYVDANSAQPPIEGNYCVDYKFNAKATTATPTNISPVTNISSGTQIKHTTDTDSYVTDSINFPPILPPQNFLRITSKTVSPTSAYGSTNATYQVTIKNDGTIPVTLDDITDTLPTSPAVPTYVAGSATFNGVAIAAPKVSGANNQILTFLTQMTIPAGGTGILQYQTTIPLNVGTYTNTAIGHVDAVQIDSTTALTDNVPLQAAFQMMSYKYTDLSLTKTMLTNPVIEGGDVEYKVSLKNNGPDNSAGSIVTDVLPSGMTFVSAGSDSRCVSANTSTITCTIGALVNGATTDIIIKAHIPYGSALSIANTATVSTTEIDNTTGNNSATQTSTVTPVRPDLKITKTANNSNPTAGDTITYTLQVSNQSSVAASGVYITDTLSAGLSFVSSPDNCSMQSGVVTCVIGSIAANTNKSVSFNAQISPTFTGALTNNAKVFLDQVDPDTTNNDTANPGHPDGGSNITVNPFPVDVAIKKTGDKTSVPAGGTVTYTLSAINNSSQPAHNVVITDNLPSGLVFASSTSCTHSSGTVTCVIPTLAANTTSSVAFTANLDYLFSGQLTNNAQITSSDPDPNTDNNDTGNPNNPNQSSTITVTELPIDLAINLSSTPASITPGNEFTVTVDIHNKTTQKSSSGSIVVLTIPDSVTLVSNGTFGGCVQSSSTTITCTVGSIAQAAHEGFSINLQSSDLVIGTLSINASVVGNEPDPDTTNNNTEDAAYTGQKLTIDAVGADLSIQKTANVVGVVAGETVDYTISVTNNSIFAATNVLITDQLNSHLSLVSGNPGCNVDSSSNIVTCSIATIPANSTLTVTLTVKIDIDYIGTITNYASVTSDQYDPDTDNNDTANPNNPNNGEGVVINVTSQPIDLGISISSELTSTVPGGQLPLKIIVSNLNSSGESSGSTVTINLDPHLLFNPNGSASECEEIVPGVIECQVGVIEPGNTVELLINTATLGTYQGDLTINAKVVGNEADKVLSNNDTSDSNYPGSHFVITSVGTNLSIYKYVNTYTATAGDELTYTLVVQNSSSGQATGVEIIDELPTGLVFKTSDDCEESNGVVTCTLDTIAPSTSKSVTFTAEIDPNYGGPIKNAARVTSNEVDVDPSDNDTSNTDHPSGSPVTTVTLQPVDLSIAVTSQANNIHPGDRFSVNASVTNTNASGDSTGSIVYFTIPTGVTLDQSNLYPGCAANAQTIGCILDRLSPGDTFALTFDFVVQSDFAGRLVFNASVSGYEPDPNTNNNDTSDPLYTGAILNITAIDYYDLSISADPTVQNVHYNESVITSFNYELTGGKDIKNVTIKQSIPANSNFDPDNSDPRWICAPNNQFGSECTLNLGDLSGPVSGSVDFGIITGDYDVFPYTVINFAPTITSDPNEFYSESNPDNNIADEVTLNVGYANVFDPPSGFKTVTKDGPALVWKMVWINDGNITAYNVRIVDAIPAQTQYIPDSFVCEPRGASATTLCQFDALNNRVVWEGSIAPDPGGTDEPDSLNEVVLIFKTTLNPNAQGSIINRGMAYWDNNGSGSIDDEVTAGQQPQYTDNPATQDKDSTSFTVVPEGPKLPQTGGGKLANTGSNILGLLLISLGVMLQTLYVYLAETGIWARK